MKTEVYSWRLSSHLKAELEQEATRRNVPVSSVVESAVREHLHKRAQDDEAEQARIESAVQCYIGAIAGGNPRRSEMAGELIRKRMRERRAR